MVYSKKQWGSISTKSETTVTWNIVFTNECCQVVATTDTPNTAEFITEVGGITNSGCFFSTSYAGGGPGSRLIHWICVGH